MHSQRWCFKKEPSSIKTYDSAKVVGSERIAVDHHAEACGPHGPSAVKDPP